MRIPGKRSEVLKEAKRNNALVLLRCGVCRQNTYHNYTGVCLRCGRRRLEDDM